MYSFWSFFIKKSAFSYLLIVAFIVFGILSILFIPKESAPEVRIPIAIISTFLPGASAEDVEKLVTNKIEDGIEGRLDEVSEITSTSRESLSVVVIEFNTSADLDKSIQETKDEIDKIRSELPREAEDPVVTDVNFQDEPILILSLASDLAPTEFKKLSEETANILERVPGVSRVETSGVRDREVQVIVKKESLNNFEVRLVDVIGAIAKENSSLPIGGINLDGVEYNVRFEGDIDSTRDIEDIAILNKAGEPIYIRDLAFVSDGLERATTFSRTSINGEPSEQAIILSVFKKGGGDITKIADSVKNEVDRLKSSTLTDVSVLVSFDVGEFVKDDLMNLSITALQTIALVMIILFLSIGPREALIAGISIPFSFLISFIGLSASGNTINFVSLFSLILSVGILVDSAIVITEGIHTKIKRGEESKEGALKSIKEFQWPLISGTMTTIGVFLPLFFISGVTGEFIKSIPATILFVLLASMFVALGIVPLIASLFLKRDGQDKLEKYQEKITREFQNWYGLQLRKIIGIRKRENWFMVGIAVLFFLTLSFPIIGVVKVTFFPGGNEDFIFIETEGLQGSTLEETDLNIRAIEEILLDESQIESFVTTVGASSSFLEGTSGSHLANMTINLREDRKNTSQEIVKNLRKKLAVVKKTTVRVLNPEGGPPVGAPVLINFLGDDLDQIQALAEKSEGILKSIPGTTEIDSSSRETGIDIVLNIDKAKSTELGLNSTLVAETLRGAVHGITATTIKKKGEDIDVVVKMDLNPDFLHAHDTARASVDALRQIQIETSGGGVLLGSVVDISIQKGTSVIRHKDGKRIASVSSQLQDGVIAGDVVKAFEKMAETELDIPDLVEMKVGGENEEVDQSFRDMFVALFVGMIIILSILVLQFNSFRQAFFIIVIVPISLIGIFIGLAITGQPLSFPSIMGFIALSGIVVNNSIILIDTMNNLKNRHPEKSITEVVVESSTRRLRPIVLTTLTTVIGITPLIWAAALWAPLALSIIFGLSFAVILTLILVPILYNRWPGSEVPLPHMSDLGKNSFR